MSGKVAGGLALLVIGILVGVWGFNAMNSFGAQLMSSVGMQDNTGQVAIGAGVVLGLIGLVLMASGSDSNPKSGERSQ